MEYNLKNKIQITQDYLNELETRSWQEIESLQNQIANIETCEDNSSIIQLLSNLLTSYYVFVGGVENLTTELKLPKHRKASELVDDVQNTDTFDSDFDLADAEVAIAKPALPEISNNLDTLNQEAFEPFEYFVDFDEPTGEAISDEDLYGN